MRVGDQFHLLTQAMGNPEKVQKWVGLLVEALRNVTRGNDLLYQYLHYSGGLLSGTKGTLIKALDDEDMLAIYLSVADPLQLTDRGESPSAPETMQH